MTVTEPQPAEPKDKRRWFRFSRRKLLVFTFLFVVSGICLALRSFWLPLSWTADYDRERCTKIVKAIEADPQHLLGKPLEEVAKELGLEGVPWDDVSFQEPPDHSSRMYHFRGFALHVTLKRLPAGITPSSKEARSTTSAELQRHGVLWLAFWHPFVRIDGISDRKERMKQYWKAELEAWESGTAEMRREMERERQSNGK